MLRLTAPFSEKHTGDMIYAGRYYDSETIFGALESRESALTAKYSIHSLQLRDTYTPTGSIVNQASLHVLAWNHDEKPLVPGATQRVSEPQLRPQHVPARPARAPPAGDRQAVVHAARWKAHPERGRGGDAREHVELPAVEQGRAVRVSHGHERAAVPRTVGVGFFNPTTTEDAKAKSDGWWGPTCRTSGARRTISRSR